MNDSRCSPNTDIWPPSRPSSRSRTPGCSGYPSRRHPDAVRLAVDLGADVNATKDGRTALHHHAWIGDVEMVVALLAAGADPNLTDETYGTTPLHWAWHGHQPQTAALLAQHGTHPASTAPDDDVPSSIPSGDAPGQ